MTTTMADAINVESIPQELRERRAWVVWRSVEEDGRPVKPPFDPRTGRRASCSDPATWRTFEEALGALAERTYDGMGFQLGPPFVGVDLDGCRDPRTGFIDDGALAIIEQLDSYTEVSPSGRGVHILVKGELPPGRRRTRGVELYDRDRYFAVTGCHVAGTPHRVAARHAELAALHERLFRATVPASASGQHAAVEQGRPRASMSLSDQALLEKMKIANDGERFERLWSGEWLGDYPTQSEADLALCGKLAFWTGRDAERMDKLFRRSALCRPKWDERRGSTTYGEVTIARAIAGTAFTWSPREEGT